MSRPVGETPYLPNAGRAFDIPGLNAFDQDLTKALFFNLAELARRANATLPKDGQEPMTGDLDMGGFDITTVANIIMSGVGTIHNAVNNSQINISGGNSGSAGANIELYGGTHASQPEDAFYDARTHTFRQMDGTLNTVTSRGVTFPATQIASAGANTFDEYEEGTWTPVLSFGGASTGITYTTQSGNYVKIGRHVLAEFEINLTSRGSATGTAVIGGLPFQSISQTVGWIGFYTNMGFPAGTVGHLFGFGANGTIATVRYHSNTTTTSADHNAFNNTSRVIATIYYLANA